MGRIDLATKLFIGYFSASLVLIQTTINLFALFYPNFYSPEVYSVLTEFFGANFYTALLMCCMAYRFKLCAWSIGCALCEVIFVLTNLFIRDNDTYNLTIQFVSGIISLIISMYLKWKK